MGGLSDGRVSVSTIYCPCALSGTGPSMGHHELLAGFLFNCYQTLYTAYSTLYLHIHKLFLMKSPLCSKIKKGLFVTLCHTCPLMSSWGSLWHSVTVLLRALSCWGHRDSMGCGRVMGYSVQTKSLQTNLGIVLWGLVHRIGNGPRTGLDWDQSYRTISPGPLAFWLVTKTG